MILREIADIISWQICTVSVWWSCYCVFQNSLPGKVPGQHGPQETLWGWEGRREVVFIFILCVEAGFRPGGAITIQTCFTFFCHGQQPGLLVYLLVLCLTNPPWVSSISRPGERLGPHEGIIFSCRMPRHWDCRPECGNRLETSVGPSLSLCGLQLILTSVNVIFHLVYIHALFPTTCPETPFSSSGHRHNCPTYIVQPAAIIHMDQSSVRISTACSSWWSVSLTELWLKWYDFIYTYLYL